MTNTLARRIAAGAVLVAAPALIALGTATTGHAEGAITNTGPSVSQPAHHTPFPNQPMIVPGSRAHHHHQAHRAR